MRYIWSYLFGAILLVPSTASADTFDNSSVILLSNAGLGDSVLLAKINNLPCTYDVSTDQIIKLRQAGVSSSVITAMVDRCIGASRAQGANDSSTDPLVKRTPGIYLQSANESGSALKVIRPTNAAGVHTSGNGSLIFPFVTKLSVPQQSAQTIVPGNMPVFYFYFESSDSKTGDFGTSQSAAAQSPSEFSLVRFKASSGQREMTIGKASAFNANVGIDPKNTIPFTVVEIEDGIYKVTIKNPMQAGEYAFVIRAGDSRYRIYDFKVN